MRQLFLPMQVVWLIDRLEQAGHTAHVVGGCVRDSLMGIPPADWDLCTSALPEEVTACFERAGAAVIPTGLQHGTVTVVLEDRPYEITTFRTEGAYSDHRRPDSVTFVRDLVSDLSRRDFTVNAMAYHPQCGLTDPFGGLSDLEAGLIRCVGDPAQRFSEDALRILRAARFASSTGFAVEAATRQAALDRAHELLQVAPERLCAELSKLLCGRAAAQALREFSKLIFTMIPELAPTEGCPQNNPHHSYDVWEHIIHSVGEAPGDLLLRLTMLLHDVAKPACRTTDEQGVDHFRGHPEAGADLADAALRRLRLDNATRERVLLLIRHHDVRLPAELRAVRRFLARIGEEAFRRLLPVQRADTMAQSLWRRDEKLARIDGVEACINQIIAEGQCFRLRDLAVGGDDLLAIGIPAGPGLGALLSQLLELVVEEELPNERGALLRKAVEVKMREEPIQ